MRKERKEILLLPQDHNPTCFSFHGISFILRIKTLLNIGTDNVIFPFLMWIWFMEYYTRCLESRLFVALWYIKVNGL